MPSPLALIFRHRYLMLRRLCRRVICCRYAKMLRAVSASTQRMCMPRGFVERVRAAHAPALCAMRWPHGARSPFATLMPRARAP